MSVTGVSPAASRAPLEIAPQGQILGLLLGLDNGN
jgi:hypothetical protein